MTRQHLWIDLLGSWLESTGSFWEAAAWWTSGNSNYYTHITQTERILWHWNGNFLNCILQRYWMPGLIIHCWMSASLVSTTAFARTSVPGQLSAAAKYLRCSDTHPPSFPRSVSEHLANSVTCNTMQFSSVRVLSRIGTEWVFLEDYLQIYEVEQTSDCMKITSNSWIIWLKLLYGYT